MPWKSYTSCMSRILKGMSYYQIDLTCIPDWSEDLWSSPGKSQCRREDPEIPRIHGRSGRVPHWELPKWYQNWPDRNFVTHFWALESRHSSLQRRARGGSSALGVGWAELLLCTLITHSLALPEYLVCRDYFILHSHTPYQNSLYLGSVFNVRCAL